MIKSIHRAYAAGYVDGDGCFHLGKTVKKFISSVTIVSTNRDILNWFQNIWGGTIHAKKQILNQKIVYHLVQKKRPSCYFTQSIQFYLIEKFDEALIYMKFNHGEDEQKKLACIDELKHLKNSTNLVSEKMKLELQWIKLSIEPTEENYAYLAGFIDAECCLGIQKYKSKNKPNYLYKIQIQCNNTKAPIFKWLLERFGGQIHFIDRNSKDPNQRNQLTWRLSSKALSKIINKIYPFLKYKKPVCKELLKFYKTTLPNGGARHTEQFRESYAKVLKIREAIFNKVHRLNLKGTN